MLVGKLGQIWWRDEYPFPGYEGLTERTVWVPSLLMGEENNRAFVCQRDAWCLRVGPVEIDFCACIHSVKGDKVAALWLFTHLRRSEETIPVPAAAARSTSIAVCLPMLPPSNTFGHGSTKSRTV